MTPGFSSAEYATSSVERRSNYKNLTGVGQNQTIKDLITEKNSALLLTTTTTVADDYCGTFIVIHNQTPFMVNPRRNIETRILVLTNFFLPFLSSLLLTQHVPTYLREEFLKIELGTFYRFRDTKDQYPRNYVIRLPQSTLGSLPALMFLLRPGNRLSGPR